MVAGLPIDLSEPQALAAIAGSVPTNVRRLEGAMTRVAALGSLLREPVTSSLVGRALTREGGVLPSAGPAPTIEAIQAVVASVFELSRDQLVSSSRVPRIARARQMAMYLSRELTGASLPRIATAFQRDHTTVLHAIRAVQGRIEPGSETADALHRARLELTTRAAPGGVVPNSALDGTDASTGKPGGTRRDDTSHQHPSTT
jgi:chromosomal replication initiator protein